MIFEPFGTDIAPHKNLLAGNLANVSTKGLGEVIENELRHFMLNSKDKVRFSDLPPTLLTADFAETQSLNPTFLKATLYKNYGLPSESKKTVLANLADVKSKATVLEFSY